MWKAVFASVGAAVGPFVGGLVGNFLVSPPSSRPPVWLFDWGPYVFAVIGGLLRFLFPFCRMCLMWSFAPHEQTVCGDEGAHNE